MSAEVLAIITLLIIVAIYFAGVQRNKIGERNRRVEEREQKIAELIDNKANQYWDMERGNDDSGLSALAKVNLFELGSDELVRECIEKIKKNIKTDPWQGQEASTKDVDLCEFFEYVCKKRIWPSNIKVEQAVQEFQTNKEKTSPFTSS